MNTWGERLWKKGDGKAGGRSYKERKLNGFGEVCEKREKKVL